MESFLAASKVALSNLSSFERVRIVLGNQTCDLDSAVCALVRGFSEYLDGRQSGRTGLAVIPVMNIPEREFRLKTEVVYCFDRHGISSELLTFRDQMATKLFNSENGIDCEIILVDHHVLPEEDVSLAQSVIEIVDHRPRDPGWSWPGRKVTLESVGSCASLVARHFIEKHPESLNARIASILRGPILIDTCNFSKEADRATPLDVEIIETLETIGGLEASERKRVFDDLIAAKGDTSTLTVDELLIRDLKTVGTVAIPGFPMLVENFLKMDGALAAVGRFAASRAARAVVLVGLDSRESRVARDLALYLSEDERFRDKIAEALTSATRPNLELSSPRRIVDETGEHGVLLYVQGNLRATRKHILPIVREVVSSERDSTSI